MKDRPTPACPRHLGAPGPAPAAHRGPAAVLLALPLALFYFAWLLAAGARRQPRAVRAAGRRRAVQPRAGNRLLVDVPAPSAAGPPLADRSAAPPTVDVFMPVYNEPVEIVEPTIAAAARSRGARRHVCAARRR